MKQIITAKIKLQADQEQFEALRATQLAYRDALNAVSRYAHEHGKMSNQQALQRAMYNEIRTIYKLPAQMACNVPRQVGASYKTLWTRVKQNATLRKSGKTKKRFYLLVSLEVERADPTSETHKQVVGVDVGMRYLAVTSTTKGACTFHSGKRVRARANHYARLRKRLQKKGTRSATRRLVAISGRERRLKQDANHVVSKRIVDQHSNSILGLENLTDIRERTKRRKGKKATKKQRKANAASSRWSFAQLHAMIAYKACLRESMAVKVDANYTSQACPICGYTCKGNRPHQGLLFVCQNCHYTLHADLIGARNIALRTLLIRQDWMSTGVLSVRPDVSDVETKAERLKRYADLRWSSDTSPCLPGMG